MRIIKVDFVWQFVLLTASNDRKSIHVWETMQGSENLLLTLNWVEICGDYFFIDKTLAIQFVFSAGMTKCLPIGRDGVGLRPKRNATELANFSFAYGR